MIAGFVHDIWHKYHLWYFKIVWNFTHVTAREITYNNFEISLVVFMPNITTNHAITYTNTLAIQFWVCWCKIWLTESFLNESIGQSQLQNYKLCNLQHSVIPANTAFLFCFVFCSVCLLFFLLCFCKTVSNNFCFLGFFFYYPTFDIPLQ